MKVAVIGAGSWGTTIGALIADRVDSVLWARREQVAAEIMRTRENTGYLPNVVLPEALTATSHLKEAVADADVVVMAVPSHGFRQVLTGARADLPQGVPIISLSKGIEQTTLMRMTEVTHDVLRAHEPGPVGVLTGPNLAREIAAGQPAATVIAMEDAARAADLQRLFMGPTLRVYTNPDVVGSEAAGAVKNVMAIAAGMADGLGFGHNTMATLITRALAEMTRLGVALGGHPSTFAGLAGVGDLVATSMSSQSRNHRVGHGLGRGRQLDEIVTEMSMVAEGVKSTRSVLALAERHNVEMPIAHQVGRVLYEGVPVKEAIANLMGRAARSEIEPR